MRISLITVRCRDEEMRRRTTITVMLAVLMTWHVLAATSQDQWSRMDLSAEERNQLVASAKNEPFEQIAPVILKAMVDNEPMPGINPWGDAPWNIDGLNPRTRTYLMANAVWQHHMSPRDDLARAQTLLSLLRKASQPCRICHHCR